MYLTSDVTTTQAGMNNIYYLIIRFNSTFNISCYFLDSYQSIERIYGKVDDEMMENVNSEVEYVQNWPSKGEIHANGVSARYRKGLPLVIKNLNFSIKKGEKVGIVGPSGSGKSTLLYLITKNLELDS